MEPPTAILQPLSVPSVPSSSSENSGLDGTNPAARHTPSCPASCPTPAPPAPPPCVGVRLLNPSVSPADPETAAPHSLFPSEPTAPQPDRRYEITPHARSVISLARQISPAGDLGPASASSLGARAARAGSDANKRVGVGKWRLAHTPERLATAGRFGVLLVRGEVERDKEN